jgi:hypothetical protein
MRNSLYETKAEDIQRFIDAYRVTLSRADIDTKWIAELIMACPTGLRQQVTVGLRLLTASAIMGQDNAVDLTEHVDLVGQQEVVRRVYTAWKAERLKGGCRSVFENYVTGVSEQNYFLILGVPLSATDGEVKASFRHLSRAFHPDVLNEREAKSGGGILRIIKAAYAALQSTDYRKQYQQRVLGECGLRYDQLVKACPSAPWYSGHEGSLDILVRDVVSTAAPSAALSGMTERQLI